jgi:hypothetical protein
VDGIIQGLSFFRSSIVAHVKREAKLMAHTLAREAANHVTDSVWLEDIPNSICSIITRELL